MFRKRNIIWGRSASHVSLTLARLLFRYCAEIPDDSPRGRKMVFGGVTCAAEVSRCEIDIAVDSLTRQVGNVLTRTRFVTLPGPLCLSILYSSANCNKRNCWSVVCPPQGSAVWCCCRRRSESNDPTTNEAAIYAIDWPVRFVITKNQR